MLSQWEATLKCKRNQTGITYSEGDAEVTLNFSQVDVMSSAVANSLPNDLKSEAVVGVYATPNSPAWIISVLGIWKRGATVLLLDASDPKLSLDPLRYRLHNVGCQCVIICDANAPQEYLLDLQIRTQAVLFQEAIQNRASSKIHFYENCQSQQIAYIAYTSGSTNEPKAIAITHGGIMPFTESCLARFADPNTDILLQFSSLHFDACWMGFFLFCSGVPLIQYDRTRISSFQLPELMNRHRVTAAIWVPTFMTRFSNPDEFKTLRKIVVTGEPCSQEFFLRWSTKIRKLFMGYGPTEVTVGCTLEEFDNEVHLGQQTKGMDIKLLENGQIAITGPGVAKGYVLNNTIVQEISDNTDSNHVRCNYFKELNGKRYFITGDAGKRISDKKIVFETKLDAQVKIRGMRIELMAVEMIYQNALSQHFHGIQIKVIPHRIDANTPAGSYDCLIGFVIGEFSGSLSETNIRLCHEGQFISEEPIKWYFLSSLNPYLTSSNKFDRHKLISAYATKEILESDRLPIVLVNSEPANVCGFLADILKIVRKTMLNLNDTISDGVLAKTMFSDLGGNSLTWERLINEIDTLYGVNIYQCLRFRRDFSFSDLADEIALQLLFKAALIDIKGVRNKNSEKRIFCCPPVTGVPSEFRFLVERTDMTFCGINMPATFSLLNHKPDQQTFSAYEYFAARKLYVYMERIAEAIGIAIRKLQTNGPYYLCGYSWGGQLAFAIAAYLQSQNCEVAWLGILDSGYPGILKEGFSRNKEMITEIYRQVYVFIAKKYKIYLSEILPENINADLSGDAQLQLLHQYVLQQLETLKQANINTDDCHQLFVSIFQNLLAAYHFNASPLSVRQHNVTLFYTRDDGHNSAMAADPDKWQAHFDGHIQKIKLADLNHLTMLREEKFQQCFEKTICTVEQSKKTPSAPSLIEAVKTFYQSEHSTIISSVPGSIQIPIERGYIRLAVVTEEEQIPKTKELAGAQDKTEQEQPQKEIPLFEDKRLRCFEDIHGTKSPIEMSKLFEDEKGKSLCKVFVMGRAGSGKSTFCQYVTYRWANEKLWNEKFSLVVLIRLKNLVNCSDEMNLAQIIHREVIPKDRLGRRVLTQQQVEDSLAEIDPDNILYILDGFDEVTESADSNPNIVWLLKRPNIILTSRPHGAWECSRVIQFDRKCENIGFLDADISAYVEAFFQQDPQGQKLTNSIMSFLRSHPNIWGIAHIPINLMIICISWTALSQSSDLQALANMNLAELYDELIHLLTKAKHKGITFEALNQLAEIAFHQMQKTSLLLSRREVERYSQHETILKFGLLTPTNQFEKEFYFLHLTFQEFLAARYIAEKLRAKDAKIVKYVQKYKYSRRHEMVWWFVAGLLKDDPKPLNRFFNIIESEPRDIAGICHLTLMLRCMDECQLKVDAERRNRFMSHLMAWMRCDRSNYNFEILLNYLSISPFVTRQPEFVELLQSPLAVGIESLRRDSDDKLLKKIALPESVILRLCRLSADLKLNRFEPLALLEHQKLPDSVLDELESRFYDPTIYDGTEERILDVLASQPDYRPSAAKLVEFFAENPYASFRLKLKVVSIVLERHLMTDELVEAIVIFIESSYRGGLFAELVSPLAFGDVLSSRLAHLVTEMPIADYQNFYNFVLCLSNNFSNLRSVGMQRLLQNPGTLHWTIKAIKFFTDQSQVLVSVSNQVKTFLHDPDKEMRSAAIDFCIAHQKYESDFSDGVAALLECSRSKQTCRAILYFYRKSKYGHSLNHETIVKIQNLLNHAKPRVRIDALKFFCFQTQLPADLLPSVEGLVKQMASKISSRAISHDDLAFIKFALLLFHKHNAISPEALTMIEGFLEHKNGFVVSCAIHFFIRKPQFVSERVLLIMENLLISPNAIFTKWDIHIIEFWNMQSQLSPKAIQFLHSRVQLIKEKLLTQIRFYFACTPIYDSGAYDPVTIMAVIKLFIQKNLYQFVPDLTELILCNDTRELVESLIPELPWTILKNINLDKIGKLLESRRFHTIYRTYNLSVYKLPLIVSQMNEVGQAAIPDGLLYILIVKIFTEHLPLTVISATTLQIGDDHFVTLSEGSLREFVLDFRGKCSKLNLRPEEFLREASPEITSPHCLFSPPRSPDTRKQDEEPTYDSSCELK